MIKHKAIDIMRNKNNSHYKNKKVNKNKNKSKKSVKAERKPIHNIKQHFFTVLINKKMSYHVKT